ncbi:hypothetical protein PINS_up008116 [Pythium insidiosum]|nr:hypothetical protein PINS_up008116 [Pythium insidiosum]
MSADVAARAAELREAATRRWLVKDELVFLLQHYELTGLPIWRVLQRRPPSGSLMFYDVNSVPDFKKDGWQWQKRKDNSGRVREDRAKLVINRAITILGTYVHSSEIPVSVFRGDESYWDNSQTMTIVFAHQTFHRRNYYLRDSHSHIILVHYFDEVNKSDPMIMHTASLAMQTPSRSGGIKRALVVTPNGRSTFAPPPFPSAFSVAENTSKPSVIPHLAQPTQKSSMAPLIKMDHEDSMRCATAMINGKLVQ